MANAIELNEYFVRFLGIVQALDTAKLFPEFAKLTKTEFRILREILVEQHKGGHIISSELARRVGVTRSAISQIVTKLEERDILKRCDAPDDRKIAYIELSETAYDIFNRECVRVNEIMAELTDKFGEEKMKRWLDACDELIATVSTLSQNTQNAQKL